MARAANVRVTKLNDLKPPMIAEATARAREGAEQFARDSKSTLSGSARQPRRFEILPATKRRHSGEKSGHQARARCHYGYVRPSRLRRSGDVRSKEYSTLSHSNFR
jgi:hypothetical protein